MRGNDQQCHIVIGEGKHSLFEGPDQDDSLIAAFHVSINGWVKQWIRQRFADCYAE